MGTGLLLGSVEKVLELNSTYGAQLCEYYKTTELYTFGIYFLVNVIVCELYLSFSKDLKQRKSLLSHFPLPVFHCSLFWE